VLDRDALHPPPAERPADIALMDPPYQQGLAQPALVALRAAGWIGPDSLIAVELMKAEDFDAPEGFGVLDERVYGKARLVFLKPA
jgi:16S rRNA (guanine966-N2)-methyltransferase